MIELQTLVLLQISLQLFDARADLHKATCTYTLDLNSLHTKKTPDFLNRVVRFRYFLSLLASCLTPPCCLFSQVDFMMSQLSFHHLGHVTVKDVEPHITAIYSLVEVKGLINTRRDGS